MRGEREKPKLCPEVTGKNDPKATAFADIRDIVEQRRITTGRDCVQLLGGFAVVLLKIRIYLNNKMN